jgi:hypothetical protein
MIVKVVIIFLVLMVLVALIGRALFPSALPPVLRKSPRAPVCPTCGRYVIGRKTCDCREKAGGRKRT